MSLLQKARIGVKTHVGFVVAGLKDEFLGMMLPVLNRSGRGGLVGRTQRDGFAPLACLEWQPAAHQKAGLQASVRHESSRRRSCVDITGWPECRFIIIRDTFPVKIKLGYSAFAKTKTFLRFSNGWSSALDNLIHEWINHRDAHSYAG